MYNILLLSLLKYNVILWRCIILNIAVEKKSNNQQSKCFELYTQKWPAQYAATLQTGRTRGRVFRHE